MGRFRTDLRKYKEYSGKSAWILLLTQQGLWALYVFRCLNRVHRSNWPGFIKSILLGFGVIWQKWIEIISGISLPYTASIGHSFYIGHFGGIIVNSSAVIGNNCNISHGVTIGVSGRGVHRGVPVIGNNVYIGAGSTVAGKIIIGDHVVIGANSLVISNVPNGVTVLGVPAQKVSDNDSNDYI